MLQGIVYHDADGRIISMNPAAERMLGDNPAEFLGSSDVGENYYAIREDGSPFPSIEHPAMVSLMTGQEVHNIVMGIYNPREKCYRWINTSSIPIIVLGEDKPFQVYTLLDDITERRQAEEALRESENKYRSIVETANEGIYLVNKEAQIIYANKRSLELLGYNLEETIGRSMWDFVSEDSRLASKMYFEKMPQGIIESYESKLMRKDGSLIWAVINTKLFFDNKGKLKGYLGMFTDITEKKSAEEALKNIEIARKKEIHHRIKNNLQVISSLLDLQAEKFKGRSNVEDSEILEAFRESQNRVISMALIHEELHKGGGFETLNFSPYIKELSENILHTYSVGNNYISLKMDLVENAFFDMDTSVPLGIIVNELVSNSFKHAFAGRSKGEIRIKLGREENGEWIGSTNEGFRTTDFNLTVSDNGVGIPENIKVKELESLGLQLVTTLVDQLDGELELKRNNGTEFIIKFKVTEEVFRQ
jgi:PAS domain S-box-containing protein